MSKTQFNQALWDEIWRQSLEVASDGTTYYWGF